MTGAWRRRWYVALIGMVLIAGTTAVAMKKVLPVYSAGSVVVMVPPMFPPRPGTVQAPAVDRNPFFAYTDAVDILSSLAVDDITGGAVRQRISEQGLSGQYSAQNFRPGTTVFSDNNPTAQIYLSASAHDYATARNTIVAVEQAIRDYLSQLQWYLGAPTNTWVGSEEVTPPQVALLHGSKTRSAAAFGLLGLIALGVGVPLSDRLLSQRAARRRKPVAPPRLLATPSADIPDADRVPVGAR